MSTVLNMRREELFGLTVSPASALSPGDCIELELVVPNLGGTVAEGMSVRFVLPESVVFEPGADVVELDPIAPGESRTVRMCARLAPAIESGTALILGAEVGVPPGRIVGSNLVVVSVISRPCLAGPETVATLIALDNGRYRALVRITNDGDATARDVRVVLPAPLGTTRALGTITRDGQTLSTQPEVVTIERLDVGATVDVTCEFAIDERFAGEQVIFAGARVACSELDPLVLAPATCAHAETVRLIDCTIEVEPLVAGRRVHARIRATNAGDIEALDVAVRVRVGLALSIDRRGVLLWEQPLPVLARRTRAAAARRDERDATILIGTLAAGRALEVIVPLDCLAACADGTAVTLEAAILLDSTVALEAACNATITSNPRFSTYRSRLTIVADPLDGSTTLVAWVMNEGTTIARCVTLTLHGNAAFAGTHAPHVLVLGDLEPSERRSTSVSIRAPHELADGACVPIGGTVAAENAPPVQLEPVTIETRAFPVIDATAWIAPTEDGRFEIVVRNTGSAAAHDVSVVLHASNELLARPQVLRFGTVPAGGAASTLIDVEDLREPGIHGGGAILCATVTARGDLVRRLDPYALDRARNVQIVAADLIAEKGEAVAGETVGYRAEFGLRGSSHAERIALALAPLLGACYVAGSTRINGHAVIDGTGVNGSLEREIVLRNVAPQTMSVAFSVRIHSALADGTTFAPTLALSIGAERHERTAPPLTVHARAPLPYQPPELGFTIDGVAIGLLSEPQVVAQAPPVELRIVDEPSIFAELPVSPADEILLTTAMNAADRASIVRYLRASTVPGFVRHLLALRVLVADRAPGAPHAFADALTQERQARKAVLDRLLIKLRIPGFAIEANDLEDRSSRTALTAVAIAANEPFAPASDPGESVASVLLSRQTIRAALDALVGAPLGSAEPFVLLAHLIGCDVRDDAALGRALACYKHQLLRALQKSVACTSLAYDAALDTALDDVIGALDATRAEAA